MDHAQRLSIHFIGWDEESFCEAWPLLSRQTWKDWHGVVVEEGGASLVAHLPKELPMPIVLRNASRLGKAKAENQSIAFALSRWEPDTFQERFILFLEEGTWLEDQTVETLLWAFSKDPSLMIACPKMMRAIRVWSDQDEEWKKETTNTVEEAGWMLTRGRRWIARGNHGPDTGEWNAAQDVFSVGSGCVMMRASVCALLEMEKGEWLDPDVRDGQLWRDACWRAQWMGCRVQCVGLARAWQLAAPLSKTVSLAKRIRHWYGVGVLRLRLCDEEQRMLIWKNDAWSVRLPHLPMIWMEGARRFFIALRDPRLFLAVLRAWKKRFCAWKKQRALFKRKKISAADMRSLFL